LNADGSLDTGFNWGVGANGTINSISDQTDGKLLLQVILPPPQSISRNRITRLNATVHHF
jgi:hypothetical protein